MERLVENCDKKHLARMKCDSQATRTVNYAVDLENDPVAVEHLLVYLGLNRGQ